jgi:predicted NBD/HSP70 family sugar kinase
MDIDIDQPDRSPPAQLGRGTRQTGVRLYNERLVLSLVREHGAVAKAAIARLTGLSPPTVSAIVGQLEADGLLLRNSPQRGRIGQPSVPISLNPDGAFSVGVKIGRRRCEIVLMDFAGGIRGELHRTYPYPTPGALVDFIKDGCRALAGDLPDDRRARIAGVGIATPFELWNWEEEVGSPPGAMQAWRDLDFQAAVEKVCDLPVYSCNDATAACAAELLFGSAAHHSEMLYIFVAWFVGGGVVLNGNVVPGRSGYAGSLGQILIPSVDGDGRPVGRQLLHCASMYLLERAIKEGGGDASAIWESPDDWSAIEPYLEAWIDRAAEGIAYAIVASVSVIDFQAVIIDGAMPAAVRRRMVARTVEKLARLERKGLPPFAVLEGSIGNRARAIGGACLPYLAKFMRDRELLFHEPAGSRSQGREPVHSARPSAF